MTLYDDLAVRYVVADPWECVAIAQQAAEAIEAAPRKRAAVGEWVQSISRWIAPIDAEDDNVVTRGKALQFLAATLKALDDAVLNGDQVQHLVLYFNTLFRDDHRGGILGSSRALRRLVAMTNFTPALAANILQSICCLEDDFKRQLPSTRIELYETVLGLMKNAAVITDLQARDGEGSFMANLMKLFENERDPNNLKVWLSALSIYLHNFDPSEDLLLETFRLFSAYFPISVRTTTEATEVTADDLKLALRACFAANNRLSKETIPYLMRKLDQGDATTIQVKLDILNTIGACVKHYKEPKTSVVPYADQIWSSLKYEVRNGDIADITSATLETLTSLTSRLEGDELQMFTANVWRDLKEDLHNPNYAGQAGRLLVAVMGASLSSFTLLGPQTLQQVKSVMGNFKGEGSFTRSISQQHTGMNDPNAPSQSSFLFQYHLLAIVTGILETRSRLINGLESGRLKQESDNKADLSDELFGDTLFNDLYNPCWTKYSDPYDDINPLQEILRGMAKLIEQKSSKGNFERLCTDIVFDRIVEVFGSQITVFYITPTLPAQGIAMRRTAEEALNKIVPEYPDSFESLLRQYLSLIKDIDRLRPTQVAESTTSELERQKFCKAIKETAFSLSRVIHLGIPDPDTTWIYDTYLINTLLQGLHFVLSQEARPAFWVPLVDSISMVLSTTLKAGAEFDTPGHVTEQSFMEFVASAEAASLPRLDLKREGEIKGMELYETGPSRPRRLYCLWVIQQLYRRFTVVVVPPAGSEETIAQIALSKDFSIPRGDDGESLTSAYEFVLILISHMATVVVRECSQFEQRALKLDIEAFCAFHSESMHHLKLQQPRKVSRKHDYQPSILTLGIVMGLHAGAITQQLHYDALEDLCQLLIAQTTMLSSAVRSAMRTLLTTLANKFNAREDEWHIEKRQETQERLLHLALTLFQRDPDDLGGRSNEDALEMFRSLVCYMAGDIRQMIINPRNPLLRTILEEAPADMMIGRQYARALGMLVKEQECLLLENHAIYRKLAGMWIWSQGIRPSLDRCFVQQGINLRMAVNHAVFVFSTLQHFPFAVYHYDTGHIVHVGMFVLSHFKIGIETEALLRVLQTILAADADVFVPHVGALVRGLVAVYETAKAVAVASKYRPDLAGVPDTDELAPVYERYVSKTKWEEDSYPDATRRLSLELLRDVVGALPTQSLIPLRRLVMRPASVACGDPDREIRALGFMARRMWNNLMGSG